MKELKLVYYNQWREFHTTALNYPDNPTRPEARAIIKFYTRTFAGKITCCSCRYHYKKLVKQMPVEAKTKTLLFNWTVDIHNEINKKLNKPIISYDIIKYWACPIID